MAELPCCCGGEAPVEEPEWCFFPTGIGEWVENVVASTDVFFRLKLHVLGGVGEAGEVDPSDHLDKFRVKPDSVRVNECEVFCDGDVVGWDAAGWCDQDEGEDEDGCG